MEIRSYLQTRVEQIRQAKNIHRGTTNLCLAAIGVRLSRIPIPSRRLRERIYRTIYGKKYVALNEAELEMPLNEYRSVNDLFTRGVRAEFRPIDPCADGLICPCDGTVQETGRLQRNATLHAKGVEYSLTSLLPNIDVTPFENGLYAIIFLSPADCHRVYSPHAAQLHEIVHVPGRRLLVHPTHQTVKYPVFTLNERIVLQLSTPIGDCILVLVAGWGVGNVTYAFNVGQARRASSRRRLSIEPPVRMERGQWLATFELGSTVILLHPGDESWETMLCRNQVVRYGQLAFRRKSSPHAAPSSPFPIGDR